MQAIISRFINQATRHSAPAPSGGRSGASEASSRERMVRSTVLGGAVAYELNDSGYKVKVYMGGAELAEQTHSSGTTWGPEFRHADPLRGHGFTPGRRREPDPLGSDAGEFNPYVSSAPPYD